MVPARHRHHRRPLQMQAHAAVQEGESKSGMVPHMNDCPQEPRFVTFCRRYSDGSFHRRLARFSSRKGLRIVRSVSSTSTQSGVSSSTVQSHG